MAELTMNCQWRGVGAPALTVTSKSGHRSSGMLDVFISYSRKDRERAALLSDLLKAEGYSVWWDEDLVGGSRFRDVIDSKLLEARKVIVLWSAHSVASHFVIDEAQSARESGKLVPLEIEPVRPPLGFRGLHTIAMHESSSLPVELVSALEGQEYSVPAALRRHRPTPAQIAAISLPIVALALVAWWAVSGWRNTLLYAAFDSTELGFHISYPSDVLTVDSSQTETGRILLRDQNQQVAVTASRLETSAPTDAKEAQSIEKTALLARSCTVTYQAPQRDANWTNWFVLSGMCHGEVFYIRRWYTSSSIVTMQFNFPEDRLPQYETIVPKMIADFSFGAAPLLVSNG